MDNAFSPLDEIDAKELSEADLAVLQAFEAMENWPPARGDREATQDSDPALFAPLAPFTSPTTPRNDNDMFMIFAAEAEEDIASMQQILKHLEQDDHLNLNHFMHLQRLGHKLHGTAGSVDFPVMSTIASHVEVIAEQITKKKIYPLVGVYALSQAITALGRYLREIVSQSKEPEGSAILTTLDITYRNLNIDLQLEAEDDDEPANLVSTSKLLDNEKNLYDDDDDTQILQKVSAHITTPLSPESVTEASQYPSENIRIDIKRFEKLTQHIEQLVDLRTILEDAQKDVEITLQDLHTSQARLQHLEPMLSLFLTTNTLLPQKASASISSSLITRILNDAIQRRGPLSFRKSRTQARPAAVPTATAWDELDMEQYSEKDLLVRSLKEAIADVSLTTARLQAAHAHLATIQQEYMSRVASARSAALQMRQAPLSILIPRLQRVVTMSALAQTQEVQFEVTGETTEIDQDVLEALAFPLVQLMRTCIANTVTGTNNTKQEKKEVSRIWLNIREIGNEIIIEIGFSMTVHGGAIDAIGDSIHRLSGKVSLQRNGDGGVSFFLHIPRLQGAVRCLLVRVNLQKLVIPFSQVQRVVDRRREMLNEIYLLRDLLGFPSPAVANLAEHSQSVLLMQKTEFGQIGIAVDEIISEVELFVKPLQSYLQRPGIMGTAVDGKGSVTLMVDLPSLVKHYMHAVILGSSKWEAKQNAGKPDPLTRQTRVLVADDAVYLRHSVRQTLQHANYKVIEARDGIEAIEKLQESIPEVCVLDVEMPNLNGYDVLNIVRQTPEFKSMKVIMLTSRSSEKHKLHAIELGAHAYLTKPCSQETLLATIQGLLTTH